MLDPVKLHPICKDYLWGGTKLKTNYAKQDNHEVIAESWELSTHQDGESYIASGPYQGECFTMYMKKLGESGLGTKCKEADMPILIKFIDASEDLSIQVHPDDTYAKFHEQDHGKTEMWVILDHEPDASLYFGLKENISRDELKQRMKDGTILDVLHKVKVQKGDVFFIEAGTIHAIGAGIVLCEIQQSSNVTYRIFDYKRMDKDGNARPLHIEKALDVAHLWTSQAHCEPEEELIDTPSLYIALLKRCPYFTVYKYQILKEVQFHVDKTSFCCITILDGMGILLYDDKRIPFQKGETIFIPAQDHIIDVQGACEFLATTL